jgi:hypothetical protein
MLSFVVTLWKSVEEGRDAVVRLGTRYPSIQQLGSDGLVPSVGGVPFAVAQLPERAIKGPFELSGSAINGLWEGRRLMAHGNRLETCDTGLQHAAFVVVAPFMAVLIAEVHLDTGDLVTEAPHRALHCSLYLLG